MSGEFRFETFVDVHSNIFNEYLSSVIAKLPKENEEYRAVQVKIKKLYEKYPKVFGVFDMEKTAELTKEEMRGSDPGNGTEKQAYGLGNAVHLFPWLL